MAKDMASIFSKMTLTREQALFWASKLADFGTPFAEAHNMITKKVDFSWMKWIYIDVLSVSLFDTNSSSLLTLSFTVLSISLDLDKRILRGSKRRDTEDIRRQTLH